MNKNLKNRWIPREGEIDVVYIWCDTINPDYIRSRKKYSQQYKLNSYWSPTRDHWEILHSIKSVRKNMSWVRNIFICSPRWHRVQDLDTEKYNVHYVDNQEILWEENCPNFNSHSLELFTYKIPNLSEYFIQCNDDFFVNQNTLLDDFYSFEKLKIKYYYENILVLWKVLSKQTKKNIKDITWDSYYFWPAHTPRMFYRNDLKDIIKKYNTSCEYTKRAKFRTKEDFQLVYMYWYYLLSQDTGEFIFLKNTTKWNSLFYFLNILLKKIFSENPISVMVQIYLQIFYKKKLYRGKIFSEKNIYSLIHIWDDYIKNREEIDHTLNNRIKFLCLNDGYDTSQKNLWDKIFKENYQYFYNRLLKSWKK